jgi:hypothetical protein
LGEDYGKIEWGKNIEDVIFFDIKNTIGLAQY